MQTHIRSSDRRHRRHRCRHSSNNHAIQVCLCVRVCVCIDYTLEYYISSIQNKNKTVIHPVLYANRFTIIIIIIIVSTFTYILNCVNTDLNLFVCECVRVSVFECITLCRLGEARHAMV